MRHKKWRHCQLREESGQLEEDRGGPFSMWPPRGKRRGAEGEEKRRGLVRGTLRGHTLNDVGIFSHIFLTGQAQDQPAVSYPVKLCFLS